MRQLVQDDNIMIHCIGHSLGAHTCGFLGDAIKADSTYKKTSLDRITGMDPAGPNFYHKGPGITIPIMAPLDEKLDKSDAGLVDAIHTDTDVLGTIPTVGHADFYVGKSIEELGTEQFDCLPIDPICDHGRSHELLRHSIDHTSECWAHVKCSTSAADIQSSWDDRDVGCPASMDNKAQKLHFGYWWDGTPGSYGVVLGDRKTCYECTQDIHCEDGKKCDTSQHACVAPICFFDTQCPTGQTCNTATNECIQPSSCEGKRRKKRQADSCSSETSEECKAQSGYCGNPSLCPGTVLDGLCPRGQDNKCCTGMPFQEDKCTAAGGKCGDICGCEVEVLHGYCPSQYNSIKCCPQTSSNTTSETELCEEETEENGGGGNADCSQLVCKSGLTPI